MHAKLPLFNAREICTKKKFALVIRIYMHFFFVFCIYTKEEKDFKICVKQRSKKRILKKSSENTKMFSEKTQLYFHSRRKSKLFTA
jgi:hypothetical protein